MTDFSLKHSDALFAASKDIDAACVQIAVIIPTFKRPEHLEKTLLSVADQTTLRRFAAVVVENHAAGSEGAAVAARVFSQGLASGICIIEPRQGNCKAYNAAWSFARARLPDVPLICGKDFRGIQKGMCHLPNLFCR